MKKYFPYLLVGLIFIWKPWATTLAANWMEPWCILLIGLTLANGARLFKSYPHAVPFYLTSIFSGLSVVFWFSRYGAEPFEVQSALRQAAGMGLVSLLVLSGFFAQCRTETLYRLMQALLLVAWCLSVSICVERLLGHDVARHVLFFENPSMAACFIAILFFMGSHSFWAWLPMLTALVLTEATVPLAALGAGFVALAYLKWEWKYLGVPLLLAVPLFIGHPDAGYFSDRGRFEVWGWAWQWWRAQGTFVHIFGVGSGTMRVLLPLIQASNGVDLNKGPWFLFLHNDWLTVLITQGVVGYLALLYLFGSVLKRAQSRPYLCASAVAYGVVMLFNFPLHWPMHLLLGFVLVGLAFNKTSGHSQFHS